jgi:hypothetical protein
MIALDILTTWLAMTAAGFAGLSALGRVGMREEVEADLALIKRGPIPDRSPAPAEARIPIPKALLR